MQPMFRNIFTAGRVSVKPEPTAYQLEKLRAMYVATIASLASIRVLASSGKRYDAKLIKQLKRDTKKVERFEKELGVRSVDVLTDADKAELERLKIPLLTLQMTRVTPDSP